jgi:hypothetical protein
MNLSFLKCLFFSTVLFFNNSLSQTKITDNFEDINNWKKVISDGVSLDLSHNEGFIGKGIRLDFNFVSGTGYCGIKSKLNIALPDNYQFSFYIKADAPDNNLEFKLIDSSGDNVWWVNKRNFEFPKNWQKVIIKKRMIQFAWGPAGGGQIKNLASLEIIISSSQGGKGEIMLDELCFEPIESIEKPYLKPIITASSFTKKDGNPGNVFDNKSDTKWKSLSKPEEQWLKIDVLDKRDFSGLIIDWDNIDYAKQYDVLISDNDENWENVYSINNCTGKRSYVFLPDIEAKYLKIEMKESSRKKGYGILNVDLKNPDFYETRNKFYEQISKEYPKGYFPKYFHKEQSNWTVIGSDKDDKEALINEQGMLEVDKSNFSLEPFIFLDNKLITWNDVSINDSLENNHLPIPLVNWKFNDMELKLKVFSSGDSGKSIIYACYQIKNFSNSKKAGSFFIAIRPFQVLPFWQELNVLGGITKIKSMRYENNKIIVNNKSFYSLTHPDDIGFCEFDEGDITTYLRNGTLPNRKILTDHFASASGALKYDFNLSPSETKDIFLIIPFYQDIDNIRLNIDEKNHREFVNNKLKETIKFWDSKINNFEIKLPSEACRLIEILKTNLAYILINRDGPAIQPGSRTYERAWIRDGALTSSALLKFGIKNEVKEYLDWYIKYQYSNGKVPCVVDKRGPDPVPEYDSQGELIYAVLQYYLFTGDIEFLREKFNSVINSVNYIEYLRSQRKTDQYKNGGPDLKVFYGLVPESISHEGYSAKPMHSYWDDFFIMKGLKDAVTIAHILNDTINEKRFAEIRNDFKKDLYSSINLAIQNKKIEYIPGCAELGDFDATSTAIAVYPCNELENLPEPLLIRTFDKYYDYFNKRLDPTYEWENYTPYEIRICSAFLLLNEKERAHKMLDFFLSHQRPKNWNHWAEVVWRDPITPKYIGDMPHTWVASEYINFIRNIFVYEREYDESLVIGSGILEDWIDSKEGISITNLPTYYGTLNYSSKSEGNDVVFKISGDIKIPKGKIILKSPRSLEIKQVLINNRITKNFKKREVIIDEFPATVILRY